MDKHSFVRVDDEKTSVIKKEGQSLLDERTLAQENKLLLVEIIDHSMRRIFDKALNSIHYAGACQRVGRCMRLVVINNGIWVGGIVLGSPFPNIDVRDRFLGLKRYVVKVKERGLKNPWVRENREYWGRLQRIVNHARTFIFPSFQGHGFGVRSHRLLLTEGVNLWKKKYNDEVAAMDTLCDHGDSKLFLANGWTLAGETKGFCSNPKAAFTKRSAGTKPIKNNVALMRSPGGLKWVVWVKMINPTLIS